ncbi:MAG: aminotransferase class I/II-fold pyridoxal phosphate-dependent enzyme, partial [Coriobacteriales bacterium]|nr:aminotransferase class I/II-fold pyridoxal phosphate-dependent enzyme [Coriobacteriales bacterium]
MHKSISDTWSFETKAIHAGQEEPDKATDARAVPIYQTSAYVFPSAESAARRFDLSEPGNIYSRLTNPTCDVLEQRIAALEGGIGALALSSGAAACNYAVLNIARAGDHILSDKYIYGGTFSLFQNTLCDQGIDASFVDASDLEEVASAIRPDTKLIFVESLGNPHSTIVDIDALSELAHTAGIPLIVDNTFSTPYLFRPFEHGADIVVHSASKFIGGSGTS